MSTRTHVFGAAMVALLIAGPAARVDAIGVTAHIYNLNGSTADALGGPAMVLPDPGGLGATGYAFDVNEGPNLSGAINPTEYSIEMRFFIDSTAGFRKLLDFKDRTSDSGLYNLNTQMDFFPVAGGAGGTFADGVFAHLFATREAATGRFRAYVDSPVAKLDFIDGPGDATFTGPGNIIHFLRDDLATLAEDPSGFLDFVRIYDGVLSENQIAVRLTGGEFDPIIPAPAALPAGLVLMGLMGLRRRKSGR